MADLEEEERAALEERLKSALHLSIGRAVDLESSSLRINATPQFIGALVELVWAQIETAAQDLELFARHAGRKKVQIEDVLLLGRRNEGLEGLLEGFARDIRKRGEDGVDGDEEEEEREPVGVKRKRGDAGIGKSGVRGRGRGRGRGKS